MRAPVFDAHAERLRARHARGGERGAHRRALPLRFARRAHDGLGADALAGQVVALPAGLGPAGGEDAARHARAAGPAGREKTTERAGRRGDSARAGRAAALAPGGERGEGAQNMRFRDGREHACDGARTRYRAKPFPTDARLGMRASGKRTCQISDASSRKGA